MVKRTLGLIYVPLKLLQGENISPAGKINILWKLKYTIPLHFYEICWSKIIYIERGARVYVCMLRHRSVKHFLVRDRAGVGRHIVPTQVGTWHLISSHKRNGEEMLSKSIGWKFRLLIMRGNSRDGIIAFNFNIFEGEASRPLLDQG